MTGEYSVIGKTVPQIDSFEKVTGRLLFAGDLRIPGMLHAKVLRSPYPHARVVNIDATKAEAAPGVEAVVTYKDRPEKDFVEIAGYVGPVLAKTTRYVGHEVAAVAARNEEEAERALDLIEVEYEQLPAIFDVEEALEQDKIKIRPDINYTLPSIYEWGDLDKGFKESDLIVEHRNTLPSQQSAPLDRNACIANWTGDRVNVWTSTQTLFWLRNAIARYFDLPYNKVRVMNVPTGGSFGLYWANVFVPITILLARKARKPVRLELSREEVFTTIKRREIPVTYIKLGAKSDGTLCAASYTHLFDNGGCGSKLDPFQQVADMYVVPNAKCEWQGVATNRYTAGCMRGVGDLSLGYAIEQAIDKLAEKLGMDPIEIRLKNIFHTGDILHSSQEVYRARLLFNKTPVIRLTSSGMDECITAGAQAFGWKDKWKGWGKPTAADGPKRRGVGMAISSHISGIASFGFNGVTVKISSDASVTLIIGVGRMGQGAETTQAQIVAEVLGVPMDDINVADGDTEFCGNTMASIGSPCMHLVGRATKHAAEEAKRQVLKYASEKLSVTPENLDMKDGRIFVKEEPESGLTLKALMGTLMYEFLSSPEIIGSVDEGSPVDKSGKMMVAHFVEVEVDIETGKAKVIDYLAVHDSGVIVNPGVCVNQVTGGIFQGCGFALTEDLKYDEKTGMVLNPNFVDYKILKALDLPNPKISFVDVVDEHGPFGAKGIGEGTICPGPAAIASAVYNAIGVRMDPPIHPERVLETLGKLR